MELGKQLLIGLGAGTTAVITTLTFWAKGNEAFDWLKAGKSAILAFGVGFIAGFWGTPESTLMASPIYAWASLGIENLIKAIIRHRNKK